MSRKKKDKQEDVAQSAAERDPSETALADAETPADAVEEQQPAPEPSLEQQIEALRDENLRLTAELRNVAQRAQREKQEALKYAEADFAKELLIVLDDLERTLESVKTAEQVQSVAEGVRIVYEHFLKVLRGRGIEVIEAQGKPFDPRLHEAMLQRPSADHPSGIVLEEFLRGYQMHGRVLRPTKVVVSSAPPTATEEQASGEDKEENDADV
jgi:molecular chaperone GrpE